MNLDREEVKWYITLLLTISHTRTPPPILQFMMDRWLWGEYLYTRVRKLQEAGEDYIMSSFMTCMLHQVS